MAKLHRTEACEVLRDLNIPRDEDFHTLSTSKVEGLLTAAKRFRYQKPKNANGSPGQVLSRLLAKALSAMTVRCKPWFYVGPSMLHASYSGGVELSVISSVDMPSGRRGADYSVRRNGSIIRQGSAKSMKAAKTAARRQAGAAGGINGTRRRKRR